MTVLVRIALGTGVRARGRDALHDPPGVRGHRWLRPPCAATGIFASAWPFVLAGLLAPGIAQILFTFAVRDAGASRTSVTVGTAPLFAVAIALVFLDEPLVAGLVLGAALIVTGGILLASDRATARALQAHRARLRAHRHGRVRDERHPRPLARPRRPTSSRARRFATMLTGAVALGSFVEASAAHARDARSCRPALLRPLVRLLFEAFYRGRVSVVSPIVATESLWGVRSRGSCCGVRARRRGSSPAPRSSSPAASDRRLPLAGSARSLEPRLDPASARDGRCARSRPICVAGTRRTRVTTAVTSDTWRLRTSRRCDERPSRSSARRRRTRPSYVAPPTSASRRGSVGLSAWTAAASDRERHARGTG